MRSNLARKKTLPCGPEIPKLTEAEISAYMKELDSAWKREVNAIQRNYRFKDFVEAMNFVNTVAAVAEESNHHPDIAVSYNRVRLTLTTHAIGALSINDVIVAARIDAIA
jgi:4a-hydroxytetrahydrobiopterin dehydratase